jgi:EpsI family protein
MSRHFALTITLLTATLVLARISADRKPDALGRPLETISHHIQGFTAAENPALPEEILESLQATSYLARTYRKAGSPDVDLFIAFYAQQQAGKNMHSPKHCLPGSGWEIWNYASTIVPVGSRSHKVNEYFISKEGQRMVVLYWYQSKNRVVASEYTGKVLLARDALLHHTTAASIVRIVVPDQPAMVETARAFASELISEVQLCFSR